MRRHAKASSAGSIEGTGSVRGLFRRAFATPGASGDSKGSGAPSSPLTLASLLAVVAVAAGLVFGATAALAAPPIVTAGSATAEYTTATVNGEIDSDTPFWYGIQYAIDPTEEWKNTLGAFEVMQSPGHVNANAELTGLKPGTTYRYRVAAEVLSADQTEVFFIPSPTPYPTFTTKSVPAPTATMEPVSGVTANAAHFEGTVGSNAPAGPYTAAQEDAYRTKWHFECTPACPGLDGSGLGSGVVNAGDPPQQVSADAADLEENTLYEVRLVVENAGSRIVAQREFHTPLIRASVKPAPGASDGKGGYFLQGVVQPFNSKITDCHFEYGPTAAYVFQAPCSPQPTGRNEQQKLAVAAESGNFRIGYRGHFTGSIPFDASPSLVQSELVTLPGIAPGDVTVTGGPGSQAGDPPYTIQFEGELAGTNVVTLEGDPGTLARPGVGSAGAADVTTSSQGGNNRPVLVEAHVTGLTPGATYHFQLVATNGAGTETTGDRIFVPTLAPPGGECANERERIENNSLALPECRAYEQVTASAKGGSGIRMSNYNEAGGLLYQSKAGNIANSGEGNFTEANYYVATRTPTGWETLANLNGPGGSLFTAPYEFSPLPVGATLPSIFSEDFRTSLWVARKQGEVFAGRKLYLRNLDGSFTTVSSGDMSIEGASADLSHFVIGNNYFENTAPAFGPGLYEFTGTANSVPNRVDVNGGEPVSECSGEALPALQKNPAQLNSISHDGNVIVFTAVGNCGPDSPQANEIWARVGGSTSYNASASQCTRSPGDPGGACNAPSNSDFVAAAPDGSRVVFTTAQQLVNGDTDQTRDIYAYELPTASNPNPSPTLVEVSGAAGKAEVQTIVRVSEDGSAVYFEATGVLAGNEGVLGEPAEAGDRNLYVWRRDAGHPNGATKFIAQLSGDDVRAEATADGRYLVLSTATPLTLTDTDNARDVYRYDAESGEMVRVSVNVSGVGGNADDFDADFEGLSGNGYGRPLARTALSADAGEIVFNTREALDPAVDGNDEPDVYMWKEGHTTLISTGSVGGGSTAAVISASGKDIFFSTAQALTPSDLDSAGDAYDARVGGGFSFERAAGCQGESCQAPAKGAPPAASPASDRPHGSGNVPPGTASVRALSGSAMAKLGAGGKVALKLTLSQPGRVIVVGTARVGGKQQQVLAATVIATKAGQIKVPISLSRAAQVQLRKDGKLKVKLSVVVAGGTPKTTTLNLKAKGPGNPKGKGA